MKRILLIISFMILFIIVIPSVIVLAFTGNETKQTTGPSANSKAQNDAYIVPVFRTSTQQVEHVDIEQYVIGVLASEMPADFEDEALKAQALAARTYVVRHLITPTKEMKLPDDAVVTDTVHHQVYRNEKELKQQWGKQFDWKYARIVKAVNETRGQILTYEGEPIDAQFFSTSNGYTENSEEYWRNALPYLRSVASPWDEQSPKFLQRTTIPATTVEQKLNVTLPEAETIMTVTKRTTGKRIGEITIGGKTLTGREVRERLDLPSSDFSLIRKGKNVHITTKGYGHGVGMSQYGANGMAREGKTAEDIVRYYYKDIAIAPLETFASKLQAWHITATGKAE